MPYVAVATLRALPNLADTARFTDAELTAATTWFETVFEDYTGVAWEPRAATDERHQVRRSDVIILRHPRPRSVTALRTYTNAATPVAYTAAELADLIFADTGELRRAGSGTRMFTSEHGVVAVDYTHGYDAPPADVVEAAKTAIRAHLLDEYQANRQFSVATEAGIVRTSTPGPDRPFGIPEVDAVANRRNHSIPGLAVIG